MGAQLTSLRFRHFGAFAATDPQLASAHASGLTVPDGQREKSPRDAESALHRWGVHVDPAWPVSAERACIRQFREVTRSAQGTTVLFGVWNVVAGGAGREGLGADSSGEDVAFKTPEGLEEFGEPHQREFTWRQVPPAVGDPPIFSRQHRLHAKIHPLFL